MKIIIIPLVLPAVLFLTFSCSNSQENKVSEKDKKEARRTSEASTQNARKHIGEMGYNYANKLALKRGYLNVIIKDQLKDFKYFLLAMTEEEKGWFGAEATERAARLNRVDFLEQLKDNGLVIDYNIFKGTIISNAYEAFEFLKSESQDFVALLEEQDSNLWTLLMHAGDHKRLKFIQLMISEVPQLEMGEILLLKNSRDQTLFKVVDDKNNKKRTRGKYQQIVDYLKPIYESIEKRQKTPARN